MRAAGVFQLMPFWVYDKRIIKNLADQMDPLRYTYWCSHVVFDTSILLNMLDIRSQLAWLFNIAKVVPVSLTG
jgi:hypothetical protein